MTVINKPCCVNLELNEGKAFLANIQLCDSALTNEKPYTWSSPWYTKVQPLTKYYNCHRTLQSPYIGLCSDLSHSRSKHWTHNQFDRLKVLTTDKLIIYTRNKTLFFLQTFTTFFHCAVYDPIAVNNLCEIFRSQWEIETTVYVLLLWKPKLDTCWPRLFGYRATPDSHR